MIDCVGVDYFAIVIEARITHPRSYPDVVMPDMGQLGRLEALVLSDAELVHLEGLVNLQTLFLCGRISDAGLVHLEGLDQLAGTGSRPTLRSPTPGSCTSKA